MLSKHASDRCRLKTNWQSDIYSHQSEQTKFYINLSGERFPTDVRQRFTVTKGQSDRISR